MGFNYMEVNVITKKMYYTSFARGNNASDAHPH